MGQFFKFSLDPTSDERETFAGGMSERHIQRKIFYQNDDGADSERLGEAERGGGPVYCFYSGS